MANLLKQLQDYHLTTAEILYHLPDYPDLLQTFIWQHYDLIPDFPELKKFLQFWEGNIEGRMHSVRVTHVSIITGGDFNVRQDSWMLH